MKEAIRKILLNGGCVEFGRVSICNITTYYKKANVGKRIWQVSSDDYRRLHSELYSDIDDAIGTFLHILRITRG